MSEGMFFRSSRRCSIKSFSSCSRSFLSMVLSYHKKRAPGNVFSKEKLPRRLSSAGKRQGVLKILSEHLQIVKKGLETVNALNWGCAAYSLYASSHRARRLPAISLYRQFQGVLKILSEHLFLRRNRQKDVWSFRRLDYLFTAFSMYRVRIVATWALVALPLGRSMPSEPLMMVSPTVHCKASLA